MIIMNEQSKSAEWFWVEIHLSKSSDHFSAGFSKRNDKLKQQQLNDLRGFQTEFFFFVGIELIS